MNETEKKEIHKDIDLLVIGGDSYIANKFVCGTSSDFKIYCISRKKTGFKDETVCSDFFNIPEIFFLRSYRVINFVGVAHQFKKIDKNIYTKINGELPIFLANMSKKNKVKYFAQMSSLSVYGSKKIIRKDTGKNPETDYGRSKLQADIGIMKLSDSDFTTVLIRSPMIYGPGAPGNLGRLIKLSSINIPLPFNGIKNRRDMIFINNYIKILDRLFIEEASGEILISENNPVSTTDIILYIRKKLNMKISLFTLNKIFRKLFSIFLKKEYIKLFEDSFIDSHSLPDFIHELKFESIEFGIQKTIEDFILPK